MADHIDDQRYRRQQEEFISNHGGTTSREVFIAILPNIFNMLLAMLVLASFRNSAKNVRNAIEFIVIIIPCILSCTVWSEYCSEITVAAILTSAGIAFFLFKFQANRKVQKCKSKTTISQNTHLSFITNFRAFTNIITAVAILAVDFQIFPRKFAKTEVYGFSLMDTGVGLFVIANSLVAPEARDLQQKSQVIYNVSFLKNIKDCTPLLVLGIGRYVAMELAGYQSHVSEYGVHWNFFMTLASVKLFTGMLTKTIKKYCLLWGLWILAMHEYALTSKGMKNWILSNGSRDDFISANREGLTSIPGYVGLYLVGMAIAKVIHSNYIVDNTKNAKKLTSVQLSLFKFKLNFAYSKSMIMCLKLSVIAAQFCAATLICNYYFQASRRLTNSTYCMWILTLSTAVLTLLLLIDIIMNIVNDAINGETEHETDLGESTPEIFKAINYNGLVFFLLANLLTGGVNMTVKTLYTSEFHAINILIAYMMFNITVVLILYRHRIRIKL